ncbi:hypothetical protein QM012_005998 [Aureobasidium pullulans]|uniref:Uncharacterized protein n=1 Tax=Aureobasidium pullulans TaxID=5580 RepID=A0ABR0TRA6_AURPU
MRSFIPALIGLATVAVAQNVTTDCVTAFSKCYDFDLSNSGACEGQASHCKDSCSQKNAFCLQSGKSSAECQSSYDQCIGATSSSVVSINCISAVTPCYTGDGSTDNTCDSKIGECKTACSAVRDLCLSSNGNNAALCSEKYNQCLGADEVSAPSVSCIKAAEQAYLNGTAENAVSALSATCKQTCGVLLDACQTNGKSDSCQNDYLSCLGSNDLEQGSKVNCVSAAQSCYEAGTADNECSRETASCKNLCANLYDTCNSSGDNSTDASCLNYYASCVGATTVSNSTVDCISQQEQCYLDGKALNECDASNAQCKDYCANNLATCQSSGDDSVKGQCQSNYLSCLGSTKLQEPVINCVAENDACYLSGNYTDAQCDAKNAVCKTVCSRSQDACLSGNSSSVVAGCDAHYNQCLGSSRVTPVSPVSCVEIATQCFLEGTADNDCEALIATCKTSCSRSQDTCLSSNDPSVKPGCQKHYDTCLGATPQAEEAAENINCIQRFTSCTTSGIASNTCNSMAAQCKNTCSSLLDSCNSSGDNSTAAQCQGVYNGCLGSMVTSLVDYKPLDCAGQAKLCASNGTASNVCDSRNAECRNACGITNDLCQVSGSSDVKACNHLYAICLDKNAYQVTSIPASLKPTVSIPSVNTTAKITAALTTAPGSGALSTGAAFVPGPYNNGSSATADAQSGAVSVATSTESTVYVTDVVKTTVTTCPVGQTITSAGSTTVLTAPSVMTTSVTVKSTVSTTNVHTITVPVGGNNAVPSKISTSLESTVYVTDVVKSTVTTCPAGQTVTASGKTTVLTTPSVMTTSVTVKSTVSTVLTHTAIVPQSSPVSPEQTTPASVEGHVAVPTTVTLYSTKEVTITSCAPEVTNCPARQVSTTVFPTAITVSSVWSRTSSVPAASSPAGSAPAGSSPAGSSPVSPETTSAPVTIPSTMFYYSTAVVTVTSCAEDVENCPARSTEVKTSVVPTAYSVTSVISSSWTPIEYTSPAAGVPQESAPAVSAPAPIVPTSAPFAVTNSTMKSVGPKGTGIVGTGSGSKATSTYSPSQYTGAANKVGAAGLAGVAAFAAFLL